MATGESVGFPVHLGFTTARQWRERASAQRESTEMDRIEAEIEKLREQIVKTKWYLQRLLYISIP
jgi:hypothetical protein